jgi:hypothetical protein
VYMLFLEHTAYFCRAGGRIGLLTPIPWLTQTEGSHLRKRLLELGSLEIMNFSTDSHFSDALVKVVALILLRGTPSRSLMIWDAGKSIALPDQILTKIFNGQFRIDVPQEFIPILEKIYLHSVPLETLYKPTFGLRACSREAGEFTKDFLIRPKEHCKNPVPYVEASDLGEYHICWAGRWLDYQPHLMYSARSPELFLSPKILVPSLLSKRKIQAVYDDKGYFVDQSLVCISATYELPKLAENVRRPSLQAMTVQLNWATISFYFAHVVVGEALGGGAIHATPGLVGRLPIFTQSEMDKATSDNVDRIIWDICGLTDSERDTVINWYATLESPKHV